MGKGGRQRERHRDREREKWSRDGRIERRGKRARDGTRSERRSSEVAKMFSDSLDMEGHLRHRVKEVVKALWCRQLVQMNYHLHTPHRHRGSPWSLVASVKQ